MTAYTVSSSAIASVDYDEYTEELTVHFTDGTDYDYDGVPASVVQELIDAGSVGAYFNANIRNHY